MSSSRANAASTSSSTDRAGSSGTERFVAANSFSAAFNSLLNLSNSSAKAAGDAAALLKALGNPERLLLLCQMSQGELSVGDLEAALGIVQPTLSQQLGVLRQEGLVDTRREGKHIYYRLVSGDAAAVMQVLHHRICGSD